jgi:hypothetical protein
MPLGQAVAGQHLADDVLGRDGVRGVILQRIDEDDHGFPQCQPRPRAQVARCTGRRDWNMRRLSPDRNVQAMTVSQAGSPTAEQPKSITALSRPRSTSRLPSATSPCTHTGGPCQAARAPPPTPAPRARCRSRHRGPSVPSWPGRPRRSVARHGSSCAPPAAGLPRYRSGTGRTGSRPARRRRRPGRPAARWPRARRAATGRPTTATGNRTREPPGQGHRDGQRKLAGEAGQPAVLLLDLLGVPGAAGQPDRHVRAEAEGDVVPAARLDPPHRKAGPLRELRADQPGHQLRGDRRSVHGWHHPPVTGGCDTHFSVARSAP